MKTDKELLQLAARAAGITLDYRHGSDAFYYDDESTGRERFNPLDDDGQALRLAVDLCMTVKVERDGYTLVNVGTCTYADEYNVKDKHAATRRAIVRAAAVIGEGTNDGK